MKNWFAYLRRSARPETTEPAEEQKPAERPKASSHTPKQDAPATQENESKQETVRRIVDWRFVALSVLLVGLAVMLLVYGPSTFRWQPLDGTESAGTPMGSHVEHQIGAFQESNQTFPDSPLVVELTLFAEVEARRNEEFLNIFTGHEQRFRSVVSEVIRSARYQDLREPTLTTLKRKMKVALVAASGTKTMVFDDLLIPDFEARQVN